jgi:hypothetical protein
VQVTFSPGGGLNDSMSECLWREGPALETRDTCSGLARNRATHNILKQKGR